MTYDEFLASVERDSAPPADLAPELRALWFCKNGSWDEAHEIVNDLPSPMGSWIHAHLHLIEGDLGNAASWYSRAGKPARRDRDEIPEEWTLLVRANLDE